MENNTLYQMEIILQKQKDFFRQGNTLDYDFRVEQLNKLKKSILKYEKDIEQALFLDLGKSSFESYESEIGFVLASINYAKKNLKSWIKPIKVKTPRYLFKSQSKIEPNPYGTVLIIGPYNYPLQLLIEPLIGAISAGNCAMLSVSDLVSNTARLIRHIINETFATEYIYCFIGGEKNNKLLLECNFDYIFFTGSTNVGKYVMKKASEKLIPVTLELGGKSPVIVDDTAKLNVAVKRIVWGKFLNVGQTCVAPDYIFIERNIKEVFIEKLKRTIVKFYGKDIVNNPDYGKIVNKRHFARLKNILVKDKDYIIYGGNLDEEKLYIGPTLICADTWEIASMQEEIFGPILPILTYDRIEDVISFLQNKEKPLALYIFSEDKDFIEYILRFTNSGGVAINDTINHITNPNLPFGGVGKSGMGMYHGKYSFLTFSYQRSILKRSTSVNLSLIFPPFNKLKAILVRYFLK